MKDDQALQAGRTKRQWYSTMLPGLNAEKVFKVADIARMLEVKKSYVFKLIDAGVISREEWFKLPNGHIRIRAAVVRRINEGNL